MVPTCIHKPMLITLKLIQIDLFRNKQNESNIENRPDINSAIFLSGNQH